MISFKAWYERLCNLLSERGYGDKARGLIFENTAYQDYDLGMPPIESAKLFIQEWNL